ncbi:MAG: oligosaccharide flippase family protein, partial [Lachnospiraceae bacterium]|nr:oligosaccharide flippase family protein [Lachnospiraceae bacterium]
MKAGSKKTKQGANLGSSFLMLSSSKFINYGIGLVSAMLLARFRTLEEYGTYAQILMIINLVTSILLLGLPNSLNFFLARAETAEEKNHFLSLYYSVNTILSIMVGGVLVAVTPLLARIFNNPLLESFLYFIAVYPWVKIVTSSVENLLVVFQKNRLIIAYRLAHSILVVLAILFVQVMGLTFRDYIAIFLGIEALFTALTYLLANLLGGRLRFSLDRKLLRAVLIFSIPLGLSTACGTLRHEMDKFFIGLVTNTEKVALYTQAAKEMPVTMIS